MRFILAEKVLAKERKDDEVGEKGGFATMYRNACVVVRVYATDRKRRKNRRPRKR